ncbi:MAG: pseudaminic acid cytidylyltransferase [Burkholderiaceae bacterium]|nr:pseudaminic acid cytidylyltransferase [Burkholderiaceae bacterium]
MNAVAVIPARGGSKRIPRKNIRPFAGRPMIAWSIDAARASGCFERIVVSTDDAEVAEVARAAGADVPFVRPTALADDHAATVPVIGHAVRWLRDHDAGAAQQVCCIYATAPLLEADDLRQARALLQQPGTDYVFGATTFAFPVQRALVRNARGLIEPLNPALIGCRSQDLPETFHDAGMFYWGFADAFAAERPIFGPASRAWMLPRHRVQDIDTPEDWTRAELLFKAYKDLYPR